MAQAWFYDGESAVRRLVALEASEGQLCLRAGGDGLRVAPPDLVHVESRADAEIYGHAQIQGWRLGIAKPVPEEIAALLPGRQVYGGWIDRIGLGRAMAIGVAISGVVLFLGYQAPAWLAPFVPYSWEQRFGDALVGDSGQKFCNGPGGQAALDALTARLTPHPERYRVRVVNVPIVNAVALPGGTILVFRELLSEADSPDEVAGVLGHEIAHIEHRDVTEAMIRHYGFGVLLSAFGGTTGGNIDMLAAAKYSRSAESEADAASIAALRRANISPLPTAAFFKRLGKEEQKLGRIGQTLGYLSSHPLSDARRQRFAASAVKGKNYQPALDRETWEALVDICHNDPNRT